MTEWERRAASKRRGPGFLYMMSSENALYDPVSGESGKFPGRLMFYAPCRTAKDLGHESVSDTMQPCLELPGQPGARMVVIPAL